MKETQRCQSIMRRRLAAGIAFLFAFGNPGVADDAPAMLPDASKAYLVVSASALPADNPQPRWIHLVRQSGVRLAGSEDLSTDRVIFELSPARYNIRKLNFRDNANSSSDLRRFRNLPYVTLEAGKIYYYGNLVLDESGEDPRVYTHYDAELYRRACAEAPLVFGMFETEWLFPEMQAAHELPSCEPPPAEAAAADKLPAPAPETPPMRLQSDPGKAYLVIGHKLLPEGARDVSWVRLENDDGEHYWVGADTTVRALPPGPYQVFQVYHRERQAPGGTKHFVDTFPRIALEAGSLYYYGVLELDTRAEKHSLVRRYDPALLLRACGRLPEDMLAVPVEFPFDKEPGAVDCRGTAAFGTTP